PAKGFDRAVEVVKGFRRRGLDATLLVPTNPLGTLSTRSGQADRYQEMRDRVASAGVADRVVFHDWVSPQDMPAYLSLATWTLVLSQLPEGFGFVTVQSIACGTPVLSSRCGALRERFPLDHGVQYFNANEADEIVEAALLPPSPEVMRRGRQYVVSEYGIDRCVDQYAKVLRLTRHVDVVAS